LNSCSVLLNNNIFHNYINFDTILVNKYDYPIISNFTFSIDLNHLDISNYIKHFLVQYDPTYLEWPIELHILSYIINNKLESLSSYNIEFIINDTIKNNHILNTFGDSIVSLYKKESIDYFQKYINKSYDYIINDILNFSDTWDNYALSILFLRILIGIYRTIGIKNKFIILFMKLLVSNINYNPLKRLSINMTIENFEIIIDKLHPNDYREIINGF
jgi:hypothetical protein